MTETTQGGGARRQSQWPAVRDVTLNDLLDVLAAGLRDFRRAPGFGFGISAVYVVGGWILILMLLYLELPFLVYPLAAGFALVAPFVATAFYAVSCCLEQNEALSWSVVRRAVWRATRRDLGWMALITGFSFFIWMDIAAVLFLSFFGLESLTCDTGLLDLLATPTGLLFLVVGNAAGAVITLAVFSISVTSFPMLFERDCDFVTAMVTSVRVVLANRRVMAAWCALIAGLVGISLLSGLVGLFVTLPVLGHASWHLYRRVVAPAGKDG